MILLSAGHEPNAKGASYNGFNEHDEATIWVQTIYDIISAGDLYQCSIVPTGSLTDKVKWINSQSDAQLIVEIHFNSDESKRQHGSETLYMPGSEKGKWAAEIVQAEMAGLFPPSRGVKEGWYRMDKPGHVDYKGDVEGDEAIDYLLRATKPVALIIEPEFIYNREIIETKANAACVALAAAFVHVAEVLK